MSMCNILVWKKMSCEPLLRQGSCDQDHLLWAERKMGFVYGNIYLVKDSTVLIWDLCAVFSDKIER